MTVSTVYQRKNSKKVRRSGRGLCAPWCHREGRRRGCPPRALPLSGLQRSRGCQKAPVGRLPLLSSAPGLDAGGGGAQGLPVGVGALSRV